MLSSEHDRMLAKASAAAFEAAVRRILPTRSRTAANIERVADALVEVHHLRALGPGGDSAGSDDRSGVVREGERRAVPTVTCSARARTKAL